MIRYPNNQIIAKIKIIQAEQEHRFVFPKRISCFAHTLVLCLKDVFDAELAQNEIIKRTRAICRNDRIVLMRLKECLEPFFRTIVVIQQEEGNLSKVFRRLRNLSKHAQDFKVK